MGVTAQNRSKPLLADLDCPSTVIQDRDGVRTAHACFVERRQRRGRTAASKAKEYKRSVEIYVHCIAARERRHPNETGPQTTEGEHKCRAEEPRVSAE